MHFINYIYEKKLCIDSTTCPDTVLIIFCFLLFLSCGLVTDRNSCTLLTNTATGSGVPSKYNTYQLPVKKSLSHDKVHNYYICTCYIFDIYAC